MFKVECPGCKAPYQVDERRIPQSGLKMRCPKCGSSFKVESPGEAQRPAPPPVLGAVLGVTSDSLVPPPDPAAPPVVSAPRGASALKATMLGVAPAAPLAPRPAAPGPPPRPKAPSHAEQDLPAAVERSAANLPSPAARKGPPPVPARAKPPLPAPKAESEPPLEVEDFASEPPDLPATAKSSPRPPLDLPARAAPRAKPEAQRSSPTSPTRPAFERAQAPASSGSGPADLPNVAGGARKAQPSYDELDLPSVSASRPPAASAPKPAAASREAQRSFGEIELDLPDAGSVSRRSQPELDLDLPNVAAHSPRPSKRASAAEFDLPSLHEGLELPSPADNLPALGELPSLSEGGLPAVGERGLPALSQAGLPARGDAGLPSISSVPPAIAVGTTANEPRPAPISLPPLELDGPAPPRRSFGELDLDGLESAARRSPSGPRAALSSRPEDSLEADPFGEADLPPPRSLAGNPSAARGSAHVSSGPPPALAGSASANAAPVIRQAGGGTAYGEVNLGEGVSDDVTLDGAAVARAAMASDQDMEFGDVPQEPSAPAEARATAPLSAAVPSGPASRRSAQEATSAKPVVKKRALRWLAAFGVLVVGGAALAFVPELGPFGSYFIIDQLRAGQYEQLLSTTANETRTALAKDTASDAAAAARHVDEVRAASPRVRALRSFAAYVAAECELRFGADPELHARGKVLLDEFEGKDGVAYLALARAGHAASEGQFERARQLLAGAGNDADALFLRAELALRARDGAEALATWQKLDSLAASARTKFGLARAAFVSGDKNAAERAAKAALDLNPGHVGAKILLSRVAAESAREPEAIRMLEEVAKAPEQASNEERVLASTTLGDIHLARSRITRAEAAYTEALKIDPKAARALLGMGEALFRAGRYSEAQARFEASAQADPAELRAKVGVAKSKLLLERVEEAMTALKELRASDPKSLLIAYWFARALEAAGDRNEAEKIYTQGIAQAPSDPLLVDTYIGLASLQAQQGRADAARKTLAQAREKLPTSSAIHKALGDVEVSQGRFAEAEADLKKAIELDPQDLGARFRLGVAYRRDGKNDLAQRAFDEVSAQDADYPGLALERGLLFEATGRSGEALAAYEAARKKAPNDLDLMLRVGCGYASAGRSKDAEELLRKVLASRPTSAESHYCLGRALFSDGSRLADAMRLFERAVELDPNRAEYQLYLGWAALDSANLPKASRALEQAISLDQSLGEAYWQRGRLRQQSGQVKDALVDLLRALELRPARQEIHAALAEAYSELGREPQALAEWKLAVAAQPDNSTWHFRYGKLLAANRMNELARAELSKALELQQQAPRGERWLLWEAHLLLARAIGPKQEAVSHWQDFLRLGPVDSPYRAEAKAALEQLGVR